MNAPRQHLTLRWRGGRLVNGDALGEIAAEHETAQREFFVALYKRAAARTLDASEAARVEAEDASRRMIRAWREHQAASRLVEMTTRGEGRR